MDDSIEAQLVEKKSWTQSQQIRSRLGQLIARMSPGSTCPTVGVSQATGGGCQQAKEAPSSVFQWTQTRHRASNGNLSAPRSRETQGNLYWGSGRGASDLSGQEKQDGRGHPGNGNEGMCLGPPTSLTRELHERPSQKTAVLGQT